MNAYWFKIIGVNAKCQYFYFLPFKSKAWEGVKGKQARRTGRPTSKVHQEYERRKLLARLRPETLILL